MNSQVVVEISSLKVLKKLWRSFYLIVVLNFFTYFKDILTTTWPISINFFIIWILQIYRIQTKFFLSILIRWLLRYLRSKFKNLLISRGFKYQIWGYEYQFPKFILLKLKKNIYDKVFHFKKIFTSIKYFILKKYFIKYFIFIKIRVRFRPRVRGWFC